MKKKHIAKTNFTKDMLPKTRKEVFIDIIKNHFSKLLFMGVLLFIGLLPFNIFIINRDLSLLNIFSQYQSGIIEESVYLQEKTVMNQMLSVMNIIALIVFGIVLSGVMRIIRKLSFLENVTLFNDFIVGVKQNIRQYVTLFFMIGIWIAFSTFIYHLSIINRLVNNKFIYDLLGILPIGMGILFFLPVVLFTMVNIALYNNTMFQNIKLGLVTYTERIFNSLGLSMLIVFIWFMYSIQHIIIHMILMIFLPFVLPFLILIWFLYVLNRLDVLIHLKYYPELYQKGLLGIDDKD